MLSRNAVPSAEPRHPLPAPKPFVVVVRVDEGRLQFSPPIDTSRHPTVRCREDGDLTVLLQKRRGYRQVISFDVRHPDVTFLGFSAGRSRRCIQKGRIPGTPLRVDMKPEKGPHNEIFLIDVYSGPESLGTFPYRIHYEVRGEPRMFDPQIHNEGSTGGSLPPRWATRVGRRRT